MWAHRRTLARGQKEKGRRRALRLGPSGSKVLNLFCRWLGSVETMAENAEASRLEVR